MVAAWEDGRIKLWVTAAALRLRRAFPDLFLRGDYVALDAEPPATRSRRGVRAHPRPTDGSGGGARLVSRLGRGWSDWASQWSNWRLALPEELSDRQWVNVLTGMRLKDERGTCRRP